MEGHISARSTQEKIQKIINGILNGNLLIPLKITINGKVGQLTLMFILGKITLMFFVGEKNYTSKTINVFSSKWEFTKKHAWLFAIFSCDKCNMRSGEL